MTDLDREAEAVAVNIQTLVLDRVLLNIGHLVSTDTVRNMRLSGWHDQLADAFAFKLETYLLGIGKERIQFDCMWATTWWDAFKERWFPTFTRWTWFPMSPPSYTGEHLNTERYAKVCPHHHPMVDPSGRNRDTLEMHTAWLAER